MNGSGAGLGCALHCFPSTPSPPRAGPAPSRPEQTIPSGLPIPAHVTPVSVWRKEAREMK